VSTTTGRGAVTLITDRKQKGRPESRPLALARCQRRERPRRGSDPGGAEGSTKRPPV